MQSTLATERYITITDSGLVLGKCVIAPFGSDGTLALNEQPLHTLLHVAFGHPFTPRIIHKIRCAERALKHHGTVMMHLHFALAGFHRLETLEQVEQLMQANDMITKGCTPHAVMKAFGLDKNNPYHVPAGTPDGGQFTTAERAGAGSVPKEDELVFDQLLSDMEYYTQGESRLTALGADSDDLPGLSPRSLAPQGGTEMAASLEMLPVAVAAGSLLVGAASIIMNAPKTRTISLQDAESENKQQEKDKKKPEGKGGNNGQSTGDIVAPNGKPLGEKGNGPDVQVLPNGYKGKRGLEGAEELFNELTKGKGGKDVTPVGYKGKLVELPNGDRVGIRPVSTSGEPAVDVNTGTARRFKFP